LQEQLQVEKDLRVALDVQDEMWRLEKDEEIDVIECNNTCAWSNLSKGGQFIDKNSVNDKTAIKKKENPMSNKPTKEEQVGQREEQDSQRKDQVKYEESREQEDYCERGVVHEESEELSYS